MTPRTPRPPAAPGRAMRQAAPKHCGVPIKEGQVSEEMLAAYRLVLGDMHERWRDAQADCDVAEREARVAPPGRKRDARARLRECERRLAVIGQARNTLIDIKLHAGVRV